MNLNRTTAISNFDKFFQIEKLSHRHFCCRTMKLNDFFYQDDFGFGFDLALNTVVDKGL